MSRGTSPGFYGIELRRNFLEDKNATKLLLVEVEESKLLIKRSTLDSLGCQTAIGENIDVITIHIANQICVIKIMRQTR